MVRQSSLWGELCLEKQHPVTLYFNSPLLRTVSNFATTCQLAVIRVLVDCLLNNF